MTTPVALMLTLNGIVHEPPSRRRTAVKRVSSRSWDYSNQPIESQLNRCSSDSTLISTVHSKSDEWPVEPICQLTSEHSQVKAKLPSDSDSSSPPAAANIISTSNMNGDIDQINLDPLVIDDHSCTPTIPSDGQNDKEEQNDADAVETKRKAVEYAHKLNFSEAMIQQALEELGGSPTRDELLKRILEIQKDNPQTEAEAGPQVHHQPATPSSSLDSTDASSTASSESSDNLRYIVIDGSNVAMCHGNKQVFSCRGIQLVVDWFVERGHRVTAFVPSWRREEPRTDNKVEDREILFELEKKGYLSFTPSRRVAGMRVTSHDDRYILDLAHVEDGIVVSNDYFRDLAQESDEYKTITEQRLLMFSFANDRFMPPADPLGRYGPSLENFLRKKPLPTEKPPPDCPYGAKCTYGLKCKYYHADRPRYKGSVKPGHSFPMMRSRRHPPLRESVSDSHALLSNQCPPQAMTPMTQREASDPTVSASQVRGHREVKRQLAFALGHRKQPQPTSPNMGRSLQPLTSTMSADAAVYNPGTTITGSYWPNVAGHPFMPASPFHLVPPSHFNAPVDFQGLRNDISERLKASFDAPKVAYIMCKYPDVYDTQQLAYLITQEFPPS